MGYNDFFKGWSEHGPNFGGASTPAASSSAASSTTTTAPAASMATRAGASGGAGTAVQATDLLTPAFVLGSPGYKQLTGQ